MHQKISFENGFSLIIAIFKNGQNFVSILKISFDMKKNSLQNAT